MTNHNKSFELELIRAVWDELRDDEEQIVWHEPILDRYWDQLEELIKQQEIFTNIQNIKIWNVEMKKERIAALAAICRSGFVNNSCNFVDFYNANLCGEGIISISKLVDVWTTLQSFSISHNRIDTMTSGACLSRSLKSHICINRLWLTHCDLGSSPEILLVLLQSDVEHIYLEHNNIESLGAAKIAQYLEDDPPIVHLSLACNRLNDDDAILISQALKRNTNLVSLSLHTNNLTCIGAKALITCVFDGSSLNAISGSNHMLERMDILSDWEVAISFSHSFCSCIDRLLQLDRKQKIVLVLQDKDSLLQYLANIPVELIPEVLAFPHGRVDDQCQHRHLNIVYSTLRWWNMPMLYSYHNCVKSDAKRKGNNYEHDVCMY